MLPVHNLGRILVHVPLGGGHRHYGGVPALRMHLLLLPVSGRFEQGVQKGYRGQSESVKHDGQLLTGPRLTGAQVWAAAAGS